jgi:hypothetical protein
VGFPKGGPLGVRGSTGLAGSRHSIFILFILNNNFNYIDGLVVLNAHVSFRVWDPAMAGEISS